MRPILVQQWSKVFFDNELYISEGVVKFLKESKNIKKKLFEVIKLTIR